MTNSRLVLLVTIACTATASLPAQQSELRSVADGLAQEIAARGKKSVAVVDFTDLQGKPTALGRYLAEEFAVALIRSRKGFEVIDRSHLNALLIENKLTATGLMDPATAKRLGKIAGADSLLTGTMTPFNESVRVVIKVLNTETATIIAADTVNLPKTSTIDELLGSPTQETSKANVSSNRSSPEPRSGTPRPTSPVVVVRQFLYELNECRGLGNQVTCTFRITNQGPDRGVQHSCGEYERTKAFDNLGSESSASSCVIAGKSRATATLISGVPVQASLLFPNLGASASSLSVINIEGLAMNPGATFTIATEATFNVSFRNVPIVR